MTLPNPYFELTREFNAEGRIVARRRAVVVALAERSTISSSRIKHG